MLWGDCEVSCMPANSHKHHGSKQINFIDRAKEKVGVPQTPGLIPQRKAPHLGPGTLNPGPLFTIHFRSSSGRCTSAWGPSGAMKNTKREREVRKLQHMDGINKSNLSGDLHKASTWSSLWWLSDINIQRLQHLIALRSSPAAKPNTMYAKEHCVLFTSQRHKKQQWDNNKTTKLER